jgi:ribosomal protein L20A (L18A)
MVDEKDMENATKIFEERLKKEALQKLKEKIESDNKLNNVAYEILPIKDIINYSNIQITPVGDIKPGQKIESFVLK